MNTAALREQIDACRPGSDDLALPALAELAQAVEQDRAVAAELDRAQQFDCAVASALHDVPVPGDLLNRLLAQAARNTAPAAGQSATSAVLAAGSGGATDEAAPASVTAASTNSWRWSRRWLVSAAAVASVAATLAIGLGFFLPRPVRDVSETQLAEAASDWYADATRQTTGWQTYTAARAPHTALLARPTRSRSMTTDFGPATVYDLSAPGRRAVLIVIDTRDRFAVDPLPFTSVPSASRGLAIGAWQSGGQLFVLVLNQDGLRLDDLLRKARAA